MPATYVCEHGVVHYVRNEFPIMEMGFEHTMVNTEFACADCPVSVLLDQEIEVE